jgi:hypothetical protein
MAVTAQQIVDFLVANPNISDADLAAVMDAYKVTPEQVAQATNTSVAEAQQRYEAVTAPPPPVYEPVYQPVYEEPVYQPVYEAPVMTNTYFQANPDVAAAYASNSYGMSPDAYADFHWNNYGKNEQRVSPSGVAPTPVAAPVYQAPVEVYTPPAETYYNPEPVYSAPEPVYQPVYEAPVYQPEVDYYAQQFAPDVFEAPVVVPPVATNTVKDYQGKTYDTTTLLNLAKELAPSIDANRLKGGVYSTSGESIGFNYDEATKALGYAPTSAEQVVLDMARHLMNEGVTSASQIDATDTNRRFGSTYSGDGGTIYEIKRDADGNLVTSTWGKTTSDKGNIIAAATIAAAFMGIPADIGTAVLGQGASNLAVNTLGGAIFGGGTTALAGGDILQGALLGAAGGAVGSYLNTAGGTVLGDASDIAMSMADAGSTLAEIQTSLTNSGFSADVIADSLKDAANVMSPTALNAPTGVPSLLDTVNVVGAASTPSLTNLLSATSTIPIVTNNQVTTPVTNQVTTPIDTVQVVGDKPVTSTQDVINAITSNLAATNVTTPTAVTTPIDTVQVTANNPNTLDLNSVINLINAGNLDTTNLVNNVADTTKLTDDTGKKKEELTTSDVIRLVGAGTTLAAMDAANQGTDAGGQFPIIPIPADWKGQPPTVIAPRPRLQPVDFGSRNLLQGTQWEKFLSPTYGQVPAPVQYSQPSNMSYNDLMSILGSKQGYPSSANLSINDIISGIQNQYGQTPTRTMG